jgi:hypothetical protein
VLAAPAVGQCHMLTVQGHLALLQLV